MKFLLKLLLFLLVVLLLSGVLATRTSIAQAPSQPNNDDYQSGNLVIKDDAIQKPLAYDSGNNLPVPVQQTKRAPSQSLSGYSGRHYSKEEVIQLIKDYSAQYGIPADVPLCIARLESGFNQFSKNKSSSASGVMQYLSGTWKGTDEGKAGLSVFDAEANVKAAIKYMASRRSTTPWEVRNKCPQLWPL